MECGVVYLAVDDALTRSISLLKYASHTVGCYDVMQISSIFN
jgi:hypothetical protein